MRAVIRHFDALLRRIYGVFEFSDDVNCLLRLQVAEAPHPFSLSDGVEVQKGDRVLGLHLWNEHVPPIGAAGPDLAWAVRVYRMWLPSLRMAAHWLAREPGLSGVRAVGGATVVAFPDEEGGGTRFLQRLGFDLFPYRGPLGRFGEFWENFYTWGLMWAFNAASLHHRHLLRLRRTEIWMSSQEFLRRYGP
jgi:YkoP domain